jgi:hypothetical protein
MHQMRISTTQVFSVMLKSKKLEIRKKICKLKEPSDENLEESHEIEPNPSKANYLKKLMLQGYNEPD